MKIEEAAKKLKQEVGIDVNSEFKFYALYQDFLIIHRLISLYHTLTIVFKLIYNVDNINIDSTSSVGH